MRRGDPRRLDQQPVRCMVLLCSARRGEHQNGPTDPNNQQSEWDAEGCLHVAERKNNTAISESCDCRGCKKGIAVAPSNGPDQEQQKGGSGTKEEAALSIEHREHQGVDLRSGFVQKAR